MILDKIDLTLRVEEAEYNKKMPLLQKELRILTFKLYGRKKSFILVFEGWDAAGKGGTIRRITQNIDPRLYQVHQISKPTDEELQYHYLWRFYKKLPKPGQIAIFDRSWYGRILVEKVESIINAEEYKRSFEEINQFEDQLERAKIPIIKFFLHISKDEQLKRFKDREENPFKKWKITEEDWRNREKWDLYIPAIEEMLKKTSSYHSPWYVIPSENKNYARLEIIKLIIKKLKEFVN